MRIIDDAAEIRGAVREAAEGRFWVLAGVSDEARGVVLDFARHAAATDAPGGADCLLFGTRAVAHSADRAVPVSMTTLLVPASHLARGEIDALLAGCYGLAVRAVHGGGMMYLPFASEGDARLVVTMLRDILSGKAAGGAEVGAN